MTIDFSKYQSTGNDFILIDDREEKFPDQNLELVSRLCDRRFGIGADGLILIQNHPSLDFNMIYYNSDGSQSFCGNGSRAAVDFAAHLGIINSAGSFQAIDGEHSGQVVEPGTVKIRMQDIPAEPSVLSDNEFYLNTGSPHFIRLVPHVMDYDVVSHGRQVRNRQEYRDQNGTNVNFVELKPDQSLVRTYERGVEDETLSCGTGVTAVAIALHSLGKQSPVEVTTPGGKLTVEFEYDPQTGYRQVFLTGPTIKTFEGTFKG